MMYTDLDDDDLRYLQSGDFVSAQPGPWVRSANRFEQMLAANWRVGRCLFLDVETMARVVATSALQRQASEILIFDLDLQRGGLSSITVVSSYIGMPSICADTAGSLLPALRWYCSRQVNIRLAVTASGLFWFPLGSAGTHESLRC